MMPRRQHVISKVLLSQFAERSSSGHRLTAFNLAHGTARLRPVSSVGYIEHFIAHEPEAAEEVWGQVETKAGAAFAAVNDTPRSLNAEHIETLKQVLALHYIRRMSTRATFDTIYPALSAKRLEAMKARPVVLAAAGRQLLGRAPESDADIQQVLKMLRDHFDRWSPELFGEQLWAWF